MASEQKAKTIVKRVFSAILWAILVFLIIVASWLAIDKHVRKSPVPSFMGYSSLVIISGSMSGTMEVDDLIIIKDKKEYKIGDIVTFMKEGDKAPTTHRIILYDEHGNYITKGDANNVRDAVAVSKEEIFGEVILTVPKYAKFLRWLSEEGGWLYVGSVFVIIVLGTVILKSDNSEEALAEEASSNEDSQNIHPSAEEDSSQAQAEISKENPANRLLQDSNEIGEEDK